MNIKKPYSAVSSALDIEVLVLLAGTNRPLTGREVARLVGRSSHSGVLNVLRRLVEHGLVKQTEAGRALLYNFNHDHLAAPAVRILAEMRESFLRLLSEAVKSWKIAPVHVSLFGSMARGKGDVSSDIDLFIVRQDSVTAEDPVWRGQIDALATTVLKATGNHAGIIEKAESGVRQLKREEPPVIKELKSDAIVISGLEIAELLGEGHG